MSDVIEKMHTAFWAESHSGDPRDWMRAALAVLSKPENISDDACKAFYDLIAPTGIGTSGTAYMLASASAYGDVQPWEIWRNHSGGFFAQELRKALAAAFSTIGR